MYDRKVSKNPGDEDLNADGDENHTTQNVCPVGKTGAEALAQKQPCHAKKEGHQGDQQGADQCLEKTVVRDGKAYGKGIAIARSETIVLYVGRFLALFEQKKRRPKKKKA